MENMLKHVENPHPARFIVLLLSIRRLYWAAPEFFGIIGENLRSICVISVLINQHGGNPYPG
jgi:hypothetical protein